MLGLPSLGVVVFGSGALGVRSGLGPWFGPGQCQLLACFRPGAGPGSVPPGRWLSVGRGWLPVVSGGGPRPGVLGGSWVPGAR